MAKSKSEIQNEALAILLRVHRGAAGITMGGGKTLLGLHHMNENYTEYAKFLVVAPKLAVFEEWKSQTQEHKLGHLLPHMEFTTYRSITKQSYDYDVVYLDECHSLLEKHDPWLNSFTGKIIGLSGTLPKYKKSIAAKMVDKYCPVVYKYLTDEAVKANILNDYRITVHMLRLNPLKTMLMTSKQGKQWYASERDTYNYWTNRIDSASTAKETQIMRVMRMKAMMEFPSKEQLAERLLVLSNNKTIVFANTQEQADRLCVNSYHSNNPLSDENLKAFKEDKITKLSCVLQLNEGVNIPNLKEGIILHAYGNERKSSQRIGRLLRLNPKEQSAIHVLCYENTIDETWVKSALEGFDQTKINTSYL